MMSDDLPPSQSADVQKPRWFRWRLIPVTVLYFVGFTEFIEAARMTLMAVFLNIHHGWIVVDPVDPRASPFALCPSNLTLWQIHFWMGVAATASAWAWQRGRWSIAWATMALLPLLVLLFRTVFTWHDKVR